MPLSPCSATACVHMRIYEQMMARGGCKDTYVGACIPRVCVCVCLVGISERACLHALMRKAEKRERERERESMCMCVCVCVCVCAFQRLHGSVHALMPSCVCGVSVIEAVPVSNSLFYLQTSLCFLSPCLSCCLLCLFLIMVKPGVRWDKRLKMR